MSVHLAQDVEVLIKKRYMVKGADIEKWVGRPDDGGPIWAIDARQAIDEQIELGRIENYLVDGELQIDL